MEHIHRRLTDEQIRLIFRNYRDRQFTREEVQETLEVDKSQFFVLLNTYRHDPSWFSVSYQRHTPGKRQSRPSSRNWKQIPEELLAVLRETTVPHALDLVNELAK